MGGAFRKEFAASVSALPKLRLHEETLLCCMLIFREEVGSNRPVIVLHQTDKDPCDYPACYTSHIDLL